MYTGEPNSFDCEQGVPRPFTLVYRYVFLPKREGQMGVTVHTIPDTGGPSTLIDQKFVYKLWEMGHVMNLDTKKAGVCFNGIGNGRVHAYYFVKLKGYVVDLGLAKQRGRVSFSRMPMEALVVDNLQVPLITGISTLVHWDAVLPLGPFCPSLDEAKQYQREEKERTGKNTPLGVQADELHAC